MLNSRSPQQCKNGSRGDYKTPTSITGSSDSWEFLASIANVNNYMPYGMLIDNGTYSKGEDSRYGFNGYERLDDVKGDGLTNHAGAKVQAPKLGGTFLSRDRYEKKFPDVSPYSFSANNPINYIDPSGNIWEVTGNRNDLKNFKMSFELAFDNKVKVDIKNNQLNINVIPGKTLTGAEIDSYKTLKFVIDHSTVTKHKLYNKHILFFGDYRHNSLQRVPGLLDLDDFNSLLLYNDNRDVFLAILSHEAIEQFKKWDRFNNPLINWYKDDHDKGIKEELNVLGYKSVDKKVNISNFLIGETDKNGKEFTYEMDASVYNSLSRLEKENIYFALPMDGEITYKYRVSGSSEFWHNNFGWTGLTEEPQYIKYTFKIERGKITNVEESK